MLNPLFDSEADVSPIAEVGEGTKVWGLAQVRENARIGASCVIGRGAYVDTGVLIGDNCKIQNDALIYAPAQIGNGVFVGPAVVFTNDKFPRAMNLDGSTKSVGDWERVGVVVRDGASIGARAVCVAPLTIGAWAMIAAGSVVTEDVVPFSLMVGAPARRVGWVGRAGFPLKEVGNLFVCSQSDDIYQEISGQLFLEGE